MFIVPGKLQNDEDMNSIARIGFWSEFKMTCSDFKK